MNEDDARAGMAGIEAAQVRAVRAAARWRLPRWYVAATAALMAGVAAAMDFGGNPAWLIVAYCGGVSLLRIPLTARTPVRLHHSRETFAVNWPLGALLLTVAGVYVVGRVTLGAAGAPLPSTLAGLAMAAVYAAAGPAAQRMTGRRLLAVRG